MKFHTHRFRVAKRTTNSVDTTNVEHHLNVETNTQACNRCRRLKKRCSKTPPECELCVAGGHVCSFGQRAFRATTPLLITGNMQHTDSGAISSTISPRENGMQLPSPQNVQRQTHLAVTASTFDGTYLSYVHAYFRHVHRAYPFLDRQEILSNAKASTYLNIWAENPDSIILGLVLSIGSTTLERAGKLSAYDRPNLVVPYARILSGCLLSPSIKGLKILTLLSLYSLFDPNGISTWSIVGVLTRQAITFGLSRTDTSVEVLSPHQEELRHRLFWSIYVLDRMLAVSVGHAVALVDDNMNVPQPAVTVEEFASSERNEHASLLQLSRHIIQLRQLEQRILTSVHTKNQVDIANMTSADRAAISRQLRSAIDDWYSLGCLVCLPEADNIPIHSTITWLNARYYNLLILLYYPCQFNSQSQHIATGELVGYIRRYLKYNRILLENKQLPLNYITLNRLIPACLALMHCFAYSQPSNCIPKAEFGNSIAMLRAFPEAWSSAHQVANVVTEFSSIVGSHKSYAATQLVDYSESNTVPFTSTINANLRRLVVELSRITAKALGPTSCYLCLYDLDGPGSASVLLSGSSDIGTDNTTEQLNVWNLANDYDFGFL